MRIPRGLTVLPLALVACATSYVPRTNSRPELQAYVENAARLVSELGAAEACSAFSQSRWMRGDYYIFVNSVEDNVTTCHPLRADLVGRNQDQMRDENGKYFARDMISAATSPEGRGWIEYVWPRPGETASIPKSAYVVAVTGPDGRRYMVGSGGYGMVP